MSRDDLLARLDVHATSSLFVASEQESLARLRAFVAHTPTCFERTHRAGHVTGSAWVLNHGRTHVVLLHHKKLGLWLQPGGHADGDPDVAEVAAKEAREETGIEGLVLADPRIFDVDVHAIPARPAKKPRAAEPAHFHYDVRFVFQAPAGADVVVSDESHDVRWVAKDEVPKFTRDLSVLRMHAKWAP